MMTIMDSPNITRKEVTHDRIVEMAARALRRDGYDGVAVAEVMKEAGLTHGGFYAHFSSREAMIAEAIERAGRDGAARINQRMATHQASGASVFRALVEAYLDPAHLASTETGCFVAALLSETPRQSAEVKAATGVRVNRLITAVQKLLPAGSPPDSATVIASTLVGALQMARALGDNAKGAAILTANAQSLIQQYDLDTKRR